MIYVGIMFAHIRIFFKFAHKFLGNNFLLGSKSKKFRKNIMKIGVNLCVSN